MVEDQNRTWDDRYMLRLPDGMRDRIKAAAEENSRSMNAEIVWRLEQSFLADSFARTGKSGSSHEDVDDLANQLLEQFVGMLINKGWKPPNK